MAHKPPGHHHRPPLRVWLKEGLISIFLPVGFPDSVTEDFVRFRVLDLLQNIASQAALLLANRAVLQGVGVGDATSTATGAVLLTVVQDSTGRLATILFAWLASSGMASEPQKYRLLADIMNDLALLSDCLVPRVLEYRLPLLCFSGVSRALCGVMAGAVGATMTAHFAKRGNLADVSAKSSSVGTVAQLVGTMVGTFLLHRTTSSQSTWVTLFILIFLHISLNYKAVKSVVLLDINRQRASIILSNLFDESLDPRPLNNIPTPLEVSQREHLFINTNRLSHPSQTATIGLPVHSILAIMPGPPSLHTQTLHKIFAHEDHILWLSRPTKHQVHILISLSSHSLKTHLRAWAHAYILAKMVSGVAFPAGKTEGGILEKEAGEVAQALRIVDGAFGQGDGIEAALEGKGWEVGRSMICADEGNGRGDWRTWLGGQYAEDNGGKIE